MASMFCEIAGLGHPRVNVEPVTHYVRHDCVRCPYWNIFGMCAACSKVFRDYIEGRYNETWCPRCHESITVSKVWTVYESVEE